MRRNAVSDVRAAAAGRWVDVLIAIGFPADVLDEKHHPCPKCGGTDRFRLIDRGRGSVFCNQCLNKKNGDGFAALQWWLGCDFQDAVQQVADYLGISTSSGSKKGKRADPAADLEWRPWSTDMANIFCGKKTGVTESALLAAGAKLARYKRSYTVIALPIIGESLDTTKPVGWCLYNAMGHELPKWNKDGEIVGLVKTKITYGSEPGLIGLHAIERLKATGLVDVVWKTEGSSDMLALAASIPEALRDRHVVVTNSNGARQRMGWMAGFLGRHECRVVHDADVPGQAGAESCCQEIAGQGGNPINVVLPYEVAEDHGKDVRDWLNDGHTYAELQALASNSPIVPAVKTEPGEPDYSASRWPIQENILRKLQIEVLYETDEGRIRVFSRLLRKSSWINQIDRLKKERMVQICGPPAIECISTDPDGETCWSMADVREALALIASSLREKHDERGIGVWQGRDEVRNASSSLLLVNGSSVARWSDETGFELVHSPRCDGLVFDLGKDHGEWFDFDELKLLIENAADTEWCKQVIESATELFGRWRWQSGDRDPLLITGLVMATWVQTVWEWRPLVSVTGKSNAGKSYLFNTIGGNDGQCGLFGDLAFKPEKASEAGVRQGIGNTAKALLCDEFERSRDRGKILEMLRLSTRGGMVAKGTTGDQAGMQFRLRHLGWIAGIESGIERQPDANRFLGFELLAAKPGEENKLQMEPGHVLRGLGQRLLAVAIRAALRAKVLATEIKDEKVDGIESRVVESYAVPASILAVATGGSEQEARRTLQWLIQRESKWESSEDHEDLLEAIVAAPVNCGAKDGSITVGQIIESQSLWYEHQGRLAACGVTVKGDGEERVLVLAPKMVKERLLKGTDWHGQKIDQILARCKGATKGRERMAGMQPRTTNIPISNIECFNGKSHGKSHGET